MNKKMALGFPRIIIDSWDYSDQLGISMTEGDVLYNLGNLTEERCGGICGAAVCGARYLGKPEGRGGNPA